MAQGQSIRPLARPLLALSFMAGALIAQAPGSKSPSSEPKPAKSEHFNATAANITSAAGTKLRIEVFRWSTDEDREKLITALKETGADQLQTTLQALPESGYVWTDESLGYAVHYAYREPLHNGGERIILATDRSLGSWSGHPWTAKPENGFAAYPYSVIELLLNSSGRGDGRMSINSKVVANEGRKTILLENSDAAPAALKNVERANARSKN